MKKKISILVNVLVLVFALSFTVCAKEKETVDYDAESLTETAESLINAFSDMGDEDFQQFIDGSELQVNLTLMQSGIPMEKDAFVSAIEAWQSGIEECGTYEGHGKFRTEAGKDSVTMTAKADFEERDADIELVFDEKMNLESLTVSGKYSTGEILEKAGMNTILGMGTVFVVLIFISFIISLFKYIPNGEKKAQKAESEVVDQAAAAGTPKDEIDDTELIAVIAAAVAAAEGTSTDSFVVRSIKRRPSNKWGC